MKAMTGDRITALVVGILEQGHARSAIGPDERLVDAGLTSMDMVNLMLAVEAEFDLTIPANEITPGNFASIATIVALIERVAPEAQAA